MPQFDLDRMSVAEFLERFRPEMVPLSHAFSYFFAGLPLTEEDIKEYLEEPIAALPPSIVKSLPKAQVVLVPFLEKSNGKGESATGRSPPAAGNTSCSTSLRRTRQAPISTIEEPTEPIWFSRSRIRTWPTTTTTSFTKSPLWLRFP